MTLITTLITLHRKMHPALDICQSISLSRTVEECAHESMLEKDKNIVLRQTMSKKVTCMMMVWVGRANREVWLSNVYLLCRRFEGVSLKFSAFLVHGSLVLFSFQFVLLSAVLGNAFFSGTLQKSLSQLG